MKKFFLGLVIGVFITLCAFFTPYVDPRFRIQIGKILDEDIVYLKNGSIIRGIIVKESPRQILLEIDGGESTFSLDRSECIEIKKNYLLKYVRELS